MSMRQAMIRIGRDFPATADAVDAALREPDTAVEALRQVRQELWVDYCLQMGSTDTDPSPFRSRPHIRIIDNELGT